MSVRVIIGVSIGVFILPLTACSHSDPPAVIPKDQVDTATWKSAVVAIPGIRANPDMDALYDATVKECNDTQQDLNLEMTLSGTNSVLDRTDMTYVCPSRAHMVDDALTSMQKDAGDVAQACGIPKNLRTDYQQQLASINNCP